MVELRTKVATVTNSTGRSAGTTRRRFLGAGGAMALGSMAGCLDRVAGTATNTTTSPAGVMSGVATSGSAEELRAEFTNPTSHAFDTGESSVKSAPATVRSSGFLSADLDLEGWATNTAVSAQDYNSVRSNKRRSIAWFGPDDTDEDESGGDGNGDSDSVSDGTTLEEVLELEQKLLGQVAAVLEAIDRRAADETRNGLRGIEDTISTVQFELDHCRSDVCVAVQASADGRKSKAHAARDAVERENWAEAGESMQAVKAAVEEDIRRLEEALDPDDDGDGIPTVEEAVYEYLSGEPTIGEQFTVCLPDASIRSGPAIVDEITPRRILQFLTTNEIQATDSEGTLYCWGGSHASSRAETDDTLYCWGGSPTSSRADTDVLAWSWGGSRAALVEQREKKRSVVARAAGNGTITVTVVNTPPEAATGGGSGGSILVDGDRVTVSDDLDSWGAETEFEGVSATPVVVCPAVAMPEDAPMPLPAVIYFRRCKHGDEYIYTGGWLIDDGALYEDSCTLLVAEGPNEVVAFTPGDAAADAARRRALKHARRRRRSAYGASLYSGEVDADALRRCPGAFHEGEGLDRLVELVALVRDSSAGERSARTGRHPQTGKEIQIPARDGPAEGDEVAMKCIVAALDCPLAHLVDADDISTDEKAAAYDAFLQIEGVEGESRE